MPYYRPAQERPRQAKRFLTVREVEDMATAGATEILQVEGLVITDAAREAAHDLGLRIRQPEPETPAASPAAQPPRPPQPAPPHPAAQGQGAAPSVRPPAMPVGADGRRLAMAPVHGGRNDPLVRAIVQAVRANLRASAATLWKG